MTCGRTGPWSCSSPRSSPGDPPTFILTFGAVKAVTNFFAGALLDRIGRKWLIAAGMGVQAGAIARVALGATFTVWAVAAVLLGAGTAMVYPTLLAVIGDVAHPAWRARSAMAQWLATWPGLSSIRLIS